MAQDIICSPWEETKGPWLCLMSACVCPVTQLCPTLGESLDYSLPGSSLHGISQARILEWVTIAFSRESFRPRDWTRVSCAFCIGRQILYHWTTWSPLSFPLFLHFLSSLIKVILWLMFLHRQKADRGHGEVGAKAIGTCSISLSFLPGFHLDPATTPFHCPLTP